MSSPDIYEFDSFWDYFHPDQTEALFKKILKRMPAGNLAYLELLTQIARAQGMQGEFDKAHRTLNRVKRKLHGNPSRAHIRYLLERGRVFNSSNLPNEAKPLFEQAREMAQKLHEDFHAIDALHMLAIIATLEESLPLNLQAIREAETSRQEKARTWLGSLYNNAGFSYHDLGDFKTALKIFKKAEAFRIENGTEDQRRIATWCVARTLRSLERFDEALSMQMKLGKEFESIGGTDGYVFEEIGECLLALKRKKEARPYFARAYEVLSQDKDILEEPERLARLKTLGG
jgi:tetratricopeptide (TPR) repeat protein